MHVFVSITDSSVIPHVYLVKSLVSYKYLRYLPNLDHYTLLVFLFILSFTIHNYLIPHSLFISLSYELFNHIILPVTFHTYSFLNSYLFFVSYSVTLYPTLSHKILTIIYQSTFPFFSLLFPPLIILVKSIFLPSNIPIYSFLSIPFLHQYILEISFTLQDTFE